MTELLFLFGGIPLLVTSVSHVPVPAWVRCEFWLPSKLEAAHRLHMDLDTWQEAFKDSLGYLFWALNR